MRIDKNLTKVNFSRCENKKNEYIVLHYTGNKTDTAAANSLYFKSVDRGASAHYFVDSGQIVQVVKDEDVAWSVGKKYGETKLFGVCNNRNSISIEMCSSKGIIPTKTVDNTRKLVQYLMDKYNIPIENVVRHYDVCKKACPGWKGWIPTDEHLWIEFKKSLKSEKDEDTKPAEKDEDTKPAENKPTKASVAKKKKTNTQIAEEVVAGKWGNGEERIKRLKEAGYKPDTIQKLVNKKLEK